MTAKCIRSSCGRCERVFETVRDTTEFKYNCNLVLIDFFVRHGLMRADDPDFFAIVEGLHRSQPIYPVSWPTSRQDIHNDSM